MKSGNLNFLEPSGPLQACNGTPLPLPLPYFLLNSIFDIKKDQFTLTFRKNTQEEFCRMYSACCTLNTDLKMLRWTANKSSTMNMSFVELKAKRLLGKQACQFASISESQGTGTLCYM